MGCLHSYRKTADTTTSNVKTVLVVTEVKEGDSRLPLDARQAFKLKQSWKGVKRKMEDAGIEMFISSGTDKNKTVIVVTDLTEVDSRLPLDARQAFKLKHSWKAVKGKMEEAGVEMFIRHLEELLRITRRNDLGALKACTQMTDCFAT